MKSSLFSSLFALLLIASVFAACDRMKVGYLNAEHASYVPDTVLVYRTPAPDSERAKTGAPWTSTRIQGVAGTNPINYKYVRVVAKEGGDAAAFDAAVKAGEVLIHGGIVQVFPAALQRIPNGIYTLTLLVYNEDHSRELTDVLTFVVNDDEPIP